MACQEGLQGKYLELVECSDNLLHILAGPGTGKSLVLKRRVARLIETGEDPTSILAVTFTRTAANDLSRDLSISSAVSSKNVHASTLHSLCFGILIKEDVLTVTGRVPRPLMDFELRYLLTDLSESFGGIRDKERRLRAFEAVWARLQSEAPGWPTDAIDQLFQAELMRWLTFHQAMLIGEIVPETLRYLRNNPTAPERRLFRHVLADEYQDFNRAEQELVKFLAESPLNGDGTFTVVGDENQSIYGGLKYAHPDGILEFPSEFPVTRSATLDECQRCPTKVVRMANAFIRYGPKGQNARQLKEHNANGPGEVHIVQWNTVDEEVAGLARFIGKRVQGKEVEPGEILVLTPRRFIGYQIRDLLQQSGIPVRSCFFEEALDSRNARERFALLTLLARTGDRPSLRALLGLGSSSGFAGAYGRLLSHCQASGDSPWRALERLESGGLRLPYANALVPRFCWIRDQLEELKQFQGTFSDFVDVWLPQDVADVDELRELATEVASELDQGENANLVSFLDELRTRITQPELPGQQDRVYVMSLHKAKGLTNKMIVVAGCVEGLIPRTEPDLAPEEAARQYEEQRRLFYVALTRTNRTLVLSSFRRVPRWQAKRFRGPVTGSGYWVTTTASHFLNQLGDASPKPVLGSELLNATSKERRA